MTQLLAVLVALLAALGTYRLLRRPRARPPEDPGVGVPAFRRVGTRDRGSALALAEPDEG
jgi:hypothetical protein